MAFHQIVWYAQGEMIKGTEGHLSKRGQGSALCQFGDGTAANVSIHVVPYKRRMHFGAASDLENSE